MIRSLLLLSVTPFLTACGLEELFNPGASQRAAEYRASITAPAAPAAVTPPAAPTAPEPIVTPPVVEPVQVVTAPPEPQAPAVCQAIFRILSCGDNGEWIWL